MSETNATVEITIKIDGTPLYVFKGQAIERCDREFKPPQCLLLNDKHVLLGFRYDPRVELKDSER